MTISIQMGQVGLVGVTPNTFYVDTSNNIAAVTTSGFLDASKAMGYTYNSKQMAMVTTTEDGGVTFSSNWYKVSVNQATLVVTLTAA